MLKNYFKIAWRNLLKNKTFSVINIAGLAIGLSCFLVITLYVIDELSYDRFHTKADRIYRIDSDIRFGGTDLNLAVCSDPMGATLKRDYPQVEEFVRIYNNGSYLIRKGNEFINENDCIHADSTFFNVFSFPIIAGNAKTALNDPNTVVISASAAKRHFGNTNAVGKMLEVNNRPPFQVTAVFEDMPSNSHFHEDFIFSMDNVNYPWNTYLSHNFQTYVVLQPGTDPKAFEKNFAQVIMKYVFPQAQQMMQLKSMEDFEKSGNKLEYHLMPLTKIHLHSSRIAELGANGNIQYVYIFSAIALFILIIACINFMNLSTARSANRAKEVGIRKVLGTERRNLISQFLFESTVMAVISLVLAVGITYLILPIFNDISAKQLNINYLLNTKLLLLLIALPFVVGFLAGSYPAFYLSGFRPIQVLKGKLNLGSKSGNIRSVLVAFQFWISIILITGTIIVYKQLSYIQTKQLGFNKDQVVVINDSYALRGNIQAFKNEVLSIPGVTGGTISGFLPVSNSNRNDNAYFKDATMNVQQGFNMQNWTIDYDYINTMGMQILKGRNFSKQFGTDSLGIILNEEAVKLLGYPDPIGKKIFTNDNLQTKSITSYTIVGVVKNFHFESLRQNIGPLSFLLGSSTGSTEFRIKAGSAAAVISSIESIWKRMAPALPFSHNFLDESFDQMYRTEQRIGKAAMVFAILAIFIACLGLFGLATFIAEQRTKEIGIRKVLGATVQTIIRLLSKDFMILVLIAFVVAVPFAWYFMHRWLQDFAYRIDISWWMFGVAGLIVLVITLLTVSFQAIKSALMNPVKSLRTE